MEGNCSQGVILLGESSCGGFDFQSSTRDVRRNAVNQNQHQSSIPRHDLSLPSTNEEDVKKESQWKRVKWMDKMVKLMITALSYLGEDSGLDESNLAVLQRKGKWKSVSKLMDDMGYHVSPQQCEDKFNDLNKRYKNLNDLLGRGISCDVVENPALLDKIDYLNEKEKDKVRRILSSKHLFYREMCSYHNGNRLHLPHDTALQRSLHLMLINRDDHDNDELGRHQKDDHVDDNDNDDDEYEEHYLSHRGSRGIHHRVLGGPLKRLRQNQSHEDAFGHLYHVNSQECNKSYVHNLSREKRKSPSIQNHWIESKSLELEKRKLQIHAELMELERQRFKWETFSKKMDHKLEIMRMENERMKLENEKMTLELKQVELDTKLLKN